MANKSRFPISPDSRARLVLISLWGALAAATVAAPLLAARSGSFAAAMLYLLLSPACHQDPGRSFHLMGYPWAVCHRCSGIYLGLFVAAVFASPIPSALGSCYQQRVRVALGTLPLLADSLLPFTGIWTNTPWSRLATGFAFGAMLSSLLTPAVSELLPHSTRQILRAHLRGSHGDLS